MNIYKRSFLFVLSLFLFALNSCIPARKLYYFHDQTPSVFNKVDSMRLASQQKIQKGDRLNVTVSSRDNTITDFLNPFSKQNSGASNGLGIGYMVKNNGVIDFPLIGEIIVAGLTTEEASAIIKQKLNFFYKDPYVYVDLQGRVYFISGHGGNPVQILNERLTIFEAVSQFTSTNPYDIKDKVWIVREENGNRTYAQMNLNSKNIFTSPYYYLHNNDLIYIMPGKFSTFFGSGSLERNVFSVASAIFALIFAIRTFK